MAVDKDKINAIAKAIIDGCTQSQEVLLHSFYNRRPKEDETLSQFALALQDLLSKAVPTMGNTEKTIFLRQQNYIFTATVECAFARSHASVKTIQFK